MPAGPLTDRAVTESVEVPSHRLGLRIIAIEKAFKASGLILVAMATFRLEHDEQFDRLIRWLEPLSLADTSGQR